MPGSEVLSTADLSFVRDLVRQHSANVLDEARATWSRRGWVPWSVARGLAASPTSSPSCGRRPTAGCTRWPWRP